MTRFPLPNSTPATIFVSLLDRPTMHIRQRRSSGSLLNFGGQEDNKHFHVRDNSPIFLGDSTPLVGDTWLRHTGKQVGRVLEGTTDLITSPVKWLTHMQDYW